MLGVGRTAPPAAPHSRPPTRTSSLPRTKLRRLKADQDWDRLCRRCPALHVMIGKRQEWIGLGIIRADRAYRDTVGFYPESTHYSPLSVFGQRFNLDLVALRNTSCLHVGFIHEHDHAAPE